jgi:hypothetical protein
MNSKPYRIVLMGILFLGLANCTAINSSIGTYPPSTLVISTKTFSPSVTKISSSTFTPFPSPTDTMIQIPFSTLTLTKVAQQHANIVQLLETNGGCELPCWWGITPGITTWEEVNHLWNNAGITPFKQDTQWYGISDSYFSSKSVLSSSFMFDVSGGIIEYIIVEANGGFDPKDSDFHEMWASLAPEKILPLLGVPSRVEIYSAYGPGEGANTYTFHDLYIFYDERGALFVYRVKDDLNSIYKICPTFSDDGNTENTIKIILKSSDDSAPIEKLDDRYQSTKIHSLEEATKMTLEEFYKLFTEGKKLICFDTLPSVFPK